MISGNLVWVEEFRKLCDSLRFELLRGESWNADILNDICAKQVAKYQFSPMSAIPDGITLRNAIIGEYRTKRKSRLRYHVSKERVQVSGVVIMLAGIIVTVILALPNLYLTLTSRRPTPNIIGSAKMISKPADTLPKANGSAEPTFRVLFAPDSAGVHPAAVQRRLENGWQVSTFDEVAQELRARPIRPSQAWQITVTGHADGFYQPLQKSPQDRQAQIAREYHNVSIANERALAVATHLRSMLRSAQGEATNVELTSEPATRTGWTVEGERCAETVKNDNCRVALIFIR